MEHRHINAQGFTPAVIDDIISRGEWSDWIDLGKEAVKNLDVQNTIRKIAGQYANDPYEQRYNAWLNFVGRQGVRHEIQAAKLG